MSQSTTQEQLDGLAESVDQIHAKTDEIKRQEVTMTQQAWIVFGVSMFLVILSIIIPIVITEVRHKQMKEHCSANNGLLKKT